MGLINPNRLPMFRPTARNNYERAWNEAMQFCIELGKLNDKAPSEEFIKEFIDRNRTGVEKEKEKGSPSLPT